MSTQKLISFIQNNDICGDCVRLDGFLSNKRAFKKLATSFLRKMMKGNGWEGEVRFYAGGPAVSGEAILHTDKVYVQISPGTMPSLKVMYRTCNGRTDYSGGTNRFLRIEELPLLEEKIKNLIRA